MKNKQNKQNKQNNIMDKVIASQKAINEFRKIKDLLKEFENFSFYDNLVDTKNQNTNKFHKLNN